MRPARAGVLVAAAIVASASRPAPRQQARRAVPRIRCARPRSAGPRAGRLRSGHRRAPSCRVPAGSGMPPVLLNIPPLLAGPGGQVALRIGRGKGTAATGALLPRGTQCLECCGETRPNGRLWLRTVAAFRGSAARAASAESTGRRAPFRRDGRHMPAGVRAAASERRARQAGAVGRQVLERLEPTAAPLPVRLPASVQWFV